MANVSVLDCTLRDGGYVNDFNFTKQGIESILCALYRSNADFIECGFLKDNEYCCDKTLFNHIEDINSLLPSYINKDKLFLMIKFNEFDIKKLPDYANSLIKGIRLIFKKNEVNDALSACEEICKKGYNLSINLSFVSHYSKDEIKEIIKKVNDISPFAFFFVDSTGCLLKKDVIVYADLVNKHLNEDIIIGFHSHNNMQLSFSNIKAFINSIDDKRQIIADSCISGMGRGAGNMQTEILMQYCNKMYDKKFNVAPLIEIADGCLYSHCRQTPWGYNMYYFLSALYNCHPSYALYLKNNRISLFKADEILKSISLEYQWKYDEKYIEKLCNQPAGKCV